MSNLSVVTGNTDPILVLSATGTGASAITFVHDSGAENNYPGQLFPSVFEFAITDIVGSFTGLAVNLEWSPITATGTPQFQTVGTWTPLVSPVVFFPCSATGTYRLNCTSFVGGTSFNVYASIASSMPQGSGGGGGGGSVTQGTVPWVVSFNAPQHVIVDSGAGAGTQYADAAASGAHPTGTQLIGWNKGGSTELAITALSLTNAQAIEVAIVDGSGNQVTSFGGGVQFADNAASGATPTGTLSMGWDSINSKVRALKVDLNQNLLVDISNNPLIVAGGGTAGAPGTAVLTIQGIGSGTPVPISGSVAISNTPSVLTLDQTVTGTITAIDSVVAAPGNGGQMVTGASTAGSLVALNVSGVSAWSMAITGGNFTTTIYFEGSLDSTTGTDGNWVSLYGRILGTTGDVNQNNATTNNTFFEGSCGGLKFIRFRAVGGAITTGPTINVRAGTVNTVSIGTPLPAGTNLLGGIEIYDASGVNKLGVNSSGQISVIFPSAQAVTLTSTTITGTVAVTQSTSPWIVAGGGTAGTPGTAVLTVQGIGGGTAIPVSLTSTTITGTVAVTQSTSPWVDNLTQVASTVLGTPQTFGTAPTGVVIGTSSDIYVAGTRARSNQTTTAAGVQDVNVVGVLGVTNSVTNGLFASITDGTTKAGVIATTTALKTDLSSVAGTTTVTAAAGVQKVGLVGNAAATLDGAVNGAAPTNMVWTGSAPSTAASASVSVGLAASLTVLNIKASAGNVYGCTVVNKVASVIYLQFYNTASTPTLGTGVIWWIPIPVSGTVIIPPGTYALKNHTTGIAIGAAISPTGAVAPGTAPDVLIWFE
jgi:hypothetical protein